MVCKFAQEELSLSFLYRETDEGSPAWKADRESTKDHEEQKRDEPLGRMNGIEGKEDIALE